MAVYNNPGCLSDDDMWYNSSPSDEEKEQSQKKEETQIDVLGSSLAAVVLNDDQDRPSESPRTRARTISALDDQRALTELRQRLESTLPQIPAAAQPVNTREQSQHGSEHDGRQRAVSVRSHAQKRRGGGNTAVDVKHGSLVPSTFSNRNQVSLLFREYKKQRAQEMLQKFLKEYTGMAAKDITRNHKKVEKIRAAYLPMRLIKYCQEKDAKFTQLYNIPPGNGVRSIQELLAQLSSVVVREQLAKKYDNKSSQDMFRDFIQNVARFDSMDVDGAEAREQLAARKQLFCEAAKGHIFTYSPAVIEELMYGLLCDQTSREDRNTLFRNESLALSLYKLLTELFATRFLGSYPFAKVAVDTLLSKPVDLSSMYEQQRAHPENEQLKHAYDAALDEVVLDFLTNLSATINLQGKEEWSSLHAAFYMAVQQEQAKVPGSHSCESFVLNIFFLRSLCSELTICSQHFTKAKDPVQVRVGGALLRLAHRLQWLVGHFDTEGAIKPEELLLFAQIGKLLLPKKSTQEILASLTSIKKTS